MLHLQPRVHLHEIDGLSLKVEDELHGTGADVTHFVGDGRGVRQHILLQAVRQHGGARLFEYLLLVPLHAAVAQAEHPGVAPGVAQDLHLDVPQGSHVFLQVHIAVAEGAARLGPYPVKQLVKLGLRLHHLDALAATSVHRLDQHGITEFRGHLLRPVRVRENAVAAGNHGHLEPGRGGDGVGLVAHGFHGGDRRPDEVDAVAAHQFGKLGVLGQEADSRVQGIHSLLFGHAEHAARIQVALVRRVAADADQGVPPGQPVDHRRLHVRVGLHQHHLDFPLLGDPHQLGGGAAPGVDQHALHRPDEVCVGEPGAGRHHHRPFPAEDTGHDALHDLGHGLLGHGNLRVDAAQVGVEIRVERVPDQPLHGRLVHRQVVGKDRVERQVARHHDLPRKRHARSREVVGLHQRMGDEAGLGAAGAVAVAENDHRQVVVAHEAGDAVVDRGHGEQRARPFLGLHAAGADEADHRHVLHGALHEQLAEFLAAGHVERARLEADVGQHHAAGQVAVYVTVQGVTPPRAPLEPGHAGDDAAGRGALVQRILDGMPEAGKTAGVGTDQVAEAFLPAGKEFRQDGFVGEAMLPLVTVQDVLHQQVAVGHVQPVPEVLAAADVPGRDAAVVGLALPFGLHQGAEQVLEQVGHHHKQGIGKIREAGALPLLHRPEELAALRQPAHAAVPVQELPAQRMDLAARPVPAGGRPRCCQRLADQRLQRLL